MNFKEGRWKDIDFKARTFFLVFSLPFYASTASTLWSCCGLRLLGPVFTVLRGILKNLSFKLPFPVQRLRLRPWMKTSYPTNIINANFFDGKKHIVIYHVNYLLLSVVMSQKSVFFVSVNLTHICRSLLLFVDLRYCLYYNK